MLARFAQRGVLAALVLAVSTDPADACGRRAVCYYPIHDCWCHPWCPGPVYSVSHPPVNINGPWPTILRTARMGHGVIVEVDAASGTNPFPTDHIHVHKTGGTGEFHYEGFNKCVLHPGLSGGPVRFSIFLLPRNPGPVEISVHFVMTDGSVKKVPFAFEIFP